MLFDSKIKLGDGEVVENAEDLLSTVLNEFIKLTSGKGLSLEERIGLFYKLIEPLPSAFFAYGRMATHLLRRMESYKEEL
jgi:hypothetical protein